MCLHEGVAMDAPKIRNPPFRSRIPEAVRSMNAAVQ